MTEATHKDIAVFLKATGRIKQIIHTPVRDADKQHLAWGPDYDFAEVPADTKHDLHQIDPATKQRVPRVNSPEEDAIQAMFKLRHDTYTKISAGFTSAALGKARQYPSAPQDQANMAQVAQVGGKLWSMLDGTWELLDHTAAQGQMVLKDYVTMRDIAR